MKHLLTVLFFVSLGQICLGQIIIQGQIIDAQTSAKIEGVAIKHISSQQGTFSDQYGQFQLEVNRLPADLLISHISYQNQSIKFTGNEDSLFIILLIPEINRIKEVTVTTQEIVQAISKMDEYSVSDFEILNNQIYRLDFHGSFKNRIISITNLEGQKLNTLELKGFRGIEGLYKGCNDVVYVIDNLGAHPIRNADNSISLGPTISADSFGQYFEPCKIRNGQSLYYIFQRKNGLMKVISKFDMATGESQTINVIADEKLINAFNNDFGFLKYSENVSTMKITRWQENTRVRRIQAHGSFLMNTMYKPKFPVHLFDRDDLLYIFNHPEGRLEIFKNDVSDRQIALDYVEDNDWLKEVLFDESSKLFYGLFHLKKGIGIKQIDTNTGSSKLVAIVDTPHYNAKDIQIYNGAVFYLNKSESGGFSTGLFRQRF